MPERTCSIEDCERSHYGRGWCRSHYQQWWRTGDPIARQVSPPDEPMLDRLLRRIEVGDCWVWTGAVNSGGYGQLKAGRIITAHRAMWETLVGPIPEGLQLDHLCRNRVCVNPDHLESVTPAENYRRGYSVWAINGRKTHCKRGHPFDEANTGAQWNGSGRYCRTCRILSKRRARAALTAAFNTLGIQEKVE